MLARSFLATVATTAQPATNGDLVIVVAITRMIVVAASMIVVVTRVCFLNLLMLTVNVRITRASMMKTAPEDRVQQHRCDGEKLARGVHVENPCTCVLLVIGYLLALVKQIN